MKKLSFINFSCYINVCNSLDQYELLLNVIVQNQIKWLSIAWMNQGLAFKDLKKEEDRFSEENHL